MTVDPHTGQQVMVQTVIQPVIQPVYVQGQQ